MNNVKKRNIPIDCLKLFLILCVIWGHAINFFNDEINYLNPIYRFIYSFHMPVFMALSGFFSCSMNQRPFSENFKLRFKQLIMPSLIGGVFVVIFIDYYSGSSSRIGGLLFSFWFLKSLFICSILWTILQKFRYKIFFSILIAIVLQFINLYKLDLMWPSYLCGVFLRSIYKEKIIPNIGIITILFGFLFLICELNWNVGMYGHKPYTFDYAITHSVSDNTYMLGIKIWRLVIGIIGIIFFICLFELINKFNFIHNYMNKISFLGKETLGIYIIQFFLIEMILGNYIKFNNQSFISYNFIIIPLCTLTIFFLSVIIINTSVIF